jgi:hypothetical protein
VDQAPLAQRPGVGLLDRGDQPGRPVGDDQQRAGQAAGGQVGEEVVPGVGGLPGAGRQAGERGLALGGDAPRGQHRLGRGARVHPEEAGVQEQVVQHDAVQGAGRPCLVLVLDLLAHRRHGGLGDRGLVAERVGQGGLDVADRQAADEGRDDEGFEGIRPGHVAAEQAGRERLGGAAQLGPGQRDRPGSGLDRHVPVAVTRTGPGVFGQLGAGVAAPAEELGDLGLEGGLHQQLRAEPGHLLQDLRQRPVLGEQAIDVAVDTVGRRYSCRHGCRSFPSMSW